MRILEHVQETKYFSSTVALFLKTWLSEIVKIPKDKTYLLRTPEFKFKFCLVWEKLDFDQFHLYII